ncbi:uncharacterized protein PFL1_03628 [Pseudozyma flocculosa PF-1]|uniref:Rho-GAP domain-containing protein n=2 Tax=Pseudozyma flocculosa TaxID=84751 RepID=A0A5C3F6G2_9BASI|nr:uncharacterized protein PFL1_03628 [Pseudozyma flocculosa PF-1]EPQ28825.1 hypothetical protein PFL1_03628 [Pseudozyma flocculosa PF-1]SPO39385.1 uncharacterized protein PSFLO_04866 [Pseudozyma flocculosa]
MPPGQSKAADFFDIESLGLGLSHAGRKSAEYLSRTASSSGNPHDGGPTSASDIAASLLETFRAILDEVDSYVGLYEGRLKLEEDYMRNLKQLVDRQRELDVRVDAKMVSATGLLPDTMPGLRQSWRELRDNDLRELDARAHAIETIKQAVLTPLLAFRDSQERIRKRVKEDLRTSLAHYDDMRNIHLPRVRRAYEKKAEEVEQLQTQQKAVEEQRALLATRTKDREAGGSSPGARVSSPEPEAEGSTAHRRSRSMRRRHSRAASSSSTQSQGPAHKDAPSADELSSPVSSPRPRPTAAPLSTSLPPPGNTSESLPSPNLERNRPNFFEALKSREGWEAARKEAPKKIGALLSRMREGREPGAAASGASQNVGQGDGGGPGGGPGSNAIAGLGATVGDTLRNGLGGGTGSMRANQSIALKLVKAKREVDELDKGYRKAIFDIETSRLRRSKTIKAAVTSVIECRNELAHTAQAVWMQSERSMVALYSQGVGLHEHGVESVQLCLKDLDRELAELERNLPNAQDLNDQRVTYVNYWHGELKNLLFGTPLTDYPLTVPYRLSDTVAPPLIVTKCIAFIETHALEQEGIYRTSAKQSSVKALKLAIEKDELGFQFDPERDEASAVAGTFKDYLRQLPEPVMAIPWPDRIKYTHDRDEHIRTGFAMLKGRLRRLPPIHQVTLKVIVFHLAKVAEHSASNKMTSANLSVVFSPCLLSEADHETTSVAAAMEEDKLLEDMILYCKEIFDLKTAGAPILPPVPSSGGNELSRASLGAADAAFAASSSTSLAAPAATAVAGPQDPPALPGAADLKRSNAIVPPGIGASVVEQDETMLQPKQAAPRTPERSKSNSSLKSLSPRQNSVAASIKAFEAKTPPPTLPRLNTSSVRRKGGVGGDIATAKISSAGPCSTRNLDTADTVPRAGTDPAQPTPAGAAEAVTASPAALSGEAGQTYLAASSALSASPVAAHLVSEGGGSESNHLLTPGKLTPSSLRSPLEYVIDSAQASQGHESVASSADHAANGAAPSPVAAPAPASTAEGEETIDAATTTNAPHPAPVHL